MKRENTYLFIIMGLLLVFVILGSIGCVAFGIQEAESGIHGNSYENITKEMQFDGHFVFETGYAGGAIGCALIASVAMLSLIKVLMYYIDRLKNSDTISAKSS